MVVIYNSKIIFQVIFKIRNIHLSIFKLKLLKRKKKKEEKIFKDFLPIIEKGLRINIYLFFLSKFNL
jgi:hypothetical protein